MGDFTEIYISNFAEISKIHDDENMIHSFAINLYIPNLPSQFFLGIKATTKVLQLLKLAW